MSSTVSSSALVCPHLPLHATREQLQMGHQAQRLSAAEASPTAPTNDSSVLRNKALHHSRWSCTLATFWLIHHPRTYDASPLPQKEDHILQLSPWASINQPPLCEPDVLLTPAHHQPLSTLSVLPTSLYVVHAVLSGDLGLFFKPPRKSHHHLNTAFPSFLKGLSPLCPTTHCWHILFGI